MPKVISEGLFQHLKGIRGAPPLASYLRLIFNDFRSMTEVLQEINRSEHGLSRDDAEKSYAFINRNIQNFPGNANVNDLMGEYYLSQTDTLNAIKHFSRAVEIGE